MSGQAARELRILADLLDLHQGDADEEHAIGGRAIAIGERLRESVPVVPASPAARSRMARCGCGRTKRPATPLATGSISC